MERLLPHARHNPHYFASTANSGLAPEMANRDSHPLEIARHFVVLEGDVRSHLALAPEATDDAPDTRPATQAPLDPVVVAAYQVLHGAQAAKHLGVDPARLATTPGVAQAFAALEGAVRQRIVASGDADALTLAKLEAPNAMTRVIDLGKSAPDARTKLAANKAILGLAGVVAPKTGTVREARDLIDEMTTAELEVYARSGTWPARFGDHMRRLQLTRELRQRGAITVEVTEESEYDA